MAGKHWTTKELQYLETNAMDGAEKLSKALGRTVSAVRTQASRQKISISNKTYSPRTLCAECHINPIGNDKTARSLGICNVCLRRERNRKLQETADLLELQAEKNRLTTKATKLRKRIRASGETPCR